VEREVPADGVAIEGDDLGRLDWAAEALALLPLKNCGWTWGVQRVPESAV
jgi:hypothetical protein